MLECIIPEWVYDLFIWEYVGMLTQNEINMALDWLLDKSIIVCDVVI